MANLFNDPAIERIVRYSAGGSTPKTPPKPDPKALLSRLDALAAAKRAAVDKAASYGVSTTGGQEGEGTQTQYLVRTGSGDGESSAPVSAEEFNAAQDNIDWGKEARKIAAETGYDAGIIPGGSNPYMYGAMRDQMQGHSDPLRMLRMTSMEPTKGNIGMAEMFYNNPNATRADLESAFKQANKGGGALRQVFGDDIVNAAGQIGSVVGNAILPGFGGTFGNAVGSMVAGKKFNAADAALAFAGGQAGDYLNTSFSEIGKTGANAIAGAGQGAISGARDGVQGALKGAVGGAGASLVGNAGRLADNSITELTGVNALGDVARLGTRAALTGEGLKVGDLANLGIDVAKGTDAYKAVTDYLATLDPGIDLGSLNIEGINIPGLPSMSQKDKNAILRLAVGNKTANLLTNPAGAVKNAATTAVNKVVSGGTAATKPSTTQTATDAGSSNTQRLLALMAMNQPQQQPQEAKDEYLAKVLHERDPDASGVAKLLFG